MVAFGWFVLALVFLDELLAMAAFGGWGWGRSPGWLLVWLLPLAAMLVWFLFASPKATYGGPVVRPAALGTLEASRRSSQAAPAVADTTRSHAAEHHLRYRYAGTDEPGTRSQHLTQDASR